MDGREVRPSGGKHGHPEQAFCLCGSAWFKATVAINHDGSVNGLAGPYTCIECGEQYPLGWVGGITESGDWFDPSVPHGQESTDG